MNRTFYIAGVQFRPKNEIEEAIKAISKEDYLKLEPEPDNKFDPNAIKIIFENDFLGYVPKKYSSEITALIEAGICLDCVLVDFNPKAKAWEMFKVRISDEEVEETMPDPEED